MFNEHIHINNVCLSSNMFPNCYGMFKQSTDVPPKAIHFLAKFNSPLIFLPKPFTHWPTLTSLFHHVQGSDLLP